jgi:rhodanese-related sulfurtransferase
MKEISPSELKQLIASKSDIQIIDVREDYEYDEMNINGKLIPMGEIMDRVDEIPRDKKVIMHCRSGKRSETVLKALEAQHGFTNLYNLSGGIMAYLEQQ